MNTPKGEETIFAEALRLPPEQRAAYIAQATEGNAELRQEVESLLKGYAVGDFLEPAGASQFRQTLHPTIPVTEKPGDLIGRYKLLQPIGEGGCGIVYMAEQQDPVRRRVALKIIKLGMDTKSVIARFEAERQALALMDHPNIAKVFDAGATETGRPYFVMELVRGMKITDFCDEKKLSTRERLDLFIQVCQAIQHAHQKGIIHRDIKPSNILVTMNDGVPVPKVIDFGIAKATSGQQLTDKTLFTAFEQFIGTPAYMSPEQAVLTSLDIDTRSDIYALGVLLYELLTGKTPFDAQELLALGLDEMRRTLREQEPPRPSTRLSTLPGQELSTAAQRRGLDPPKLVSELRGDLDWIVMKALEKDRARRYETANGLAADIQRHLNNEPVVACPPSTAYRFQKLVRRNKLAFTAAAAVLATLVLGILVSAWQAVVATKARASAQAAAKEAQLARISEAEERQRAIVARDAARNQEARARQRLYVANVALANEALQKDHLGRARELLQKAAEAATVDPSLGPGENPKQRDLRGWEWRYLWSQSQGDELFILGRHEPLAQVALWFPDGVRAVSAGKDGSVKFWNVDQRRLINQLSFSNRLNGLALSPDGTRVVAGETDEAASFSSDLKQRERGARLSLWDTAKLQQIWEVNLPPIGHLAYSPSGEMIAAAGYGRISVLWAKDGSSRYSLGDGSGSWFKIGLGFSPDSKSLAFARGTECRILDLQTGAVEKLLETRDELLTIAFSPDGHTLVCGDMSGAITIWDRQTGKIDRVLGSHHQQVVCVGFSSDGGRLASASADQTIKLWDARSWEEICSLRGHEFEIWSVAFSPDGTRLISAAKDDTVRIWQAAPSSRRLELPLPGPPETAWLIKRESDSALALINKDTGGFIFGNLFSGKITLQGSLPSRLLTNYSGITLVSEKIAFGFPDGRIELWGLRSQQKIWSVTNRAIAVTGMASSSKAAQIAVAYKDGLVELFQLETGEKRRSFQPSRYEHTVMAFSANGKRFLAGSPLSPELSVLNLESGQLDPLHLKHRERLLSAAFSEDGEWVITTSYDTFASLWEVESGREIARFSGQFTGFASATISPDKRRVALTSNSSDEITVWDPVTEQKLATFRAGQRAGGFLSGWDSNSDNLVALLNRKLCCWNAPSLADIEVTQGGQPLPKLAWSCGPDQWLRWAAEQGDLTAQRGLAFLYQTGQGVPKNLAEALKWHTKSAESGFPPDLNGVAWFLATCTDPALRDGRRAVRYAESAVAKTERRDWSLLDTLAAAYAEAGEFTKAINAQNESITLVADEKIKKDLEARLRLYQSNSPFRE